MKLYYFETPNPRKPCAVAKYLNAPVEFVRVDLRQGEQKAPEFLAINPNGKVPAFTDGEVRLWEAHTIMIYLAHKTGSDLWPSDPIKQIDVLRWLNWDTAHFSRHGGQLYFQNYIKELAGMGSPDEAVVEESLEFFKQFAGVLDGHLEGQDYVAGDSLTVADFGVATVLPDAEKAKLPLDGFANIARWHDSMMALPAWSDPWPAAQSAAA